MQTNDIRQEIKGTEDALRPLSTNQARAVGILLASKDQKSAAAEIGISQVTLIRWLKDPQFSAAVREAEAEALAGAARRLAVVSTAAVDVLSELLNEHQPARIRLQAARAVLDVGIRLRELASLEERLTALEDKLSTLGGK